VLLQQGEGVANGCWIKILKWGMEPFSTGHLVRNTRAESRSQIMKRREFMAPPGRKPIRPTEIEPAIRLETVLKRREKFFRFGKVLEHVGANDEIKLPEVAEILRVDVERLER